MGKSATLPRNNQPQAIMCSCVGTPSSNWHRVVEANRLRHQSRRKFGEKVPFALARNMTDIKWMASRPVDFMVQNKCKERRKNQIQSRFANLADNNAGADRAAAWLRLRTDQPPPNLKAQNRGRDFSSPRLLSTSNILPPFHQRPSLHCCDIPSLTQWLVIELSDSISRDTPFVCTV